MSKTLSHDIRLFQAGRLRGVFNRLAQLGVHRNRENRPLHSDSLYISLVRGQLDKIEKVDPKFVTKRPVFRMKRNRRAFLSRFDYNAGMLFEWIDKSMDPRVIAIRQDDSRHLARLLDSGAATANDIIFRDETLLHLTAQIGAINCARLLLDKGANIESLTEIGDSPLVQAIEHSQLAVARLLLERGALLQYTHQPRNDPQANEARENQFAAFFKQSAPQVEELFKKIERDLPADLKALAESSGESLGDLISFDPAKMALMAASVASQPRQIHAIHRCQNIEALMFLIEELAAPVNVISGEGEWPLKRFAREGSAQAVAFLLQHGADPHLTSTGGTALHDAVMGGNAECIRLLLKAGANPNQQDVDMCVPLGLVQNADSLDLLLAAGADVNITDQAGFYPFYWIKDPILKARVEALQYSSRPASPKIQ
jgi:ankyrin repeat protein